jgi:peroxiredoxin
MTLDKNYKFNILFLRIYYFHINITMRKKLGTTYLLKKTNLLFIVFLSFFLLGNKLAAFSQKIGNQNFTIEGLIKNAKNSTIYLDYFNATSYVPLDSAVCDELGKFKFTQPNEVRKFVRIRFTEQNWVTLYVLNDFIKIIGDKEGFYKNYQLINASEENKDFRNFIGELQNFTVKLDSINSLLKTHVNKPEMDSLRLVYGLEADKEIEAHTKRIKEFGDRHRSTILLCYAIYYLNKDDDYEYIENALKDLEKYNQTSVYFQYYNMGFLVRKNGIKPLTKGKIAPELLIKNTNNKIIPLSSTRGKITLVEFWESSCHGCELNHPNLVRLYKKYRKAGFEIYGVALDDDLKKWKEGIKRDNLNWINVSELKGFTTSFQFTYDVKYTPQNYLLDEYGMVIGKDLKGEDLEYKIASNLLRLSSTKKQKK